MRVTSMLQRLQDKSASDRLHLQQSLVEFGEAADEDNDVQDANNPLMDKVIEEAGDEAFRVLTNFTPSEFDIIWANVERAMNSKWFEGRGRKSKMTPKDSLYVTLTVLKHYQSCEKHAVDFSLKSPTLEKIVVKVVELCSPILESIINDNGELFRDHPNSWALLVDKGYIGLAASLRAIHP
ncbi:hypothetical protein DYB34_006637 [Aphanomyces astaci]|uniref:Uncharacterized protein n=1 Tax=Aphanomyces astaci TaxID=112090 RepID=A0A418BSA4_APHAT|nr:hypothetical protein DYB34_006637 [Aphanomyces astaci]